MEDSCEREETGAKSRTENKGGLNVWLEYTEPWDPSLVPHKLGHGRPHNLSTWVVEEEGSRVQGYPLLHSMSWAT